MDVKDKDGHFIIAQEKALREAGIESVQQESDSVSKEKLMGSLKNISECMLDVVNEFSSLVEKEADKHKIIEKEVVREMTEEEKKDMVIRYIHDHSAQALELMTSAQNYKPEESKTPEEVESFETTNGKQS